MDWMTATHFRDVEISDKSLFHVGVSGGKDSCAALIWMVRESGIPPSKVVATFCDIGNDHAWTLEHVKQISETVHPVKTIRPKLDFFALAKKKQRFPSPKARFCTEHLKIIPTQDHILELTKEGHRVISVSGTRADESEARKDKPEWDYNGTLLCLQWRPLIRWTIENVVSIHGRHAIPLNPLYALGARRVGCWPCIMSAKAEIRVIALRFPERIDQIRKAEQEIGSTFFTPNAIPPRFHTGKAFSKAQGKIVSIATIDDVVRWAMTGKGAVGDVRDDLFWNGSDLGEVISCNSGFCE